MNKEFSISIINNNYELFKKIPKTNYHTHALLSSNRKNFFNTYNRILKKYKKSDDIYSISNYIKENFIDISTTLDGQLKLFELTILTSIENGITNLHTSVDYRLVKDFYDNNCNNYVKDLKRLKEIYKDKIKVEFDIGISRNAYKKNDYNLIIKLIKTHFFSGIDLYGNELSKKITNFKKIYKVAKQEKLILKAHVGEFGSAKDVYKAVKILKLNIVQHGISIVDKKKYMKKLKNKKIIFNVCPISNIKLKRINSIKNHPIKEMVQNGLLVTINTDDELIFENSIFDEYIQLYKNNVLSIAELDTIRKNSLNMFNN